MLVFSPIVAFLISDDAHAIWIIAVGNLFAIITLIIKNIFDERKADRNRKKDIEDREEERKDRAEKLAEQEFLHRQNMERISRESEKIANEIALRTKLEGEKRTEFLKQEQDKNRNILIDKIKENTQVTKEAAAKAEEAKNITSEIKETVVKIAEEQSEAKK